MNIRMLIDGDDVTITMPGKKPRSMTLTELKDIVEGYNQVIKRAGENCCGIDAQGGDKVWYMYPTAELVDLTEEVEE